MTQFRSTIIHFWRVVVPLPVCDLIILSHVIIIETTLQHSIVFEENILILNNRICYDGSVRNHGLQHDHTLL